MCRVAAHDGAGWYVLCDDGSGSHDCAVTYGYARQNDGTMANPHVVANVCLACVAATGIPDVLAGYVGDVVVSSDECDVGCNKNVILEFYIALDDTVRPKLDVAAKGDVVVWRPNSGG